MSPKHARPRKVKNQQTQPQPAQVSSAPRVADAVTEQLPRIPRAATSAEMSIVETGASVAPRSRLRGVGVVICTVAAVFMLLGVGAFALSRSGVISVTVGSSAAELEAPTIALSQPQPGGPPAATVTTPTTTATPSLTTTTVTPTTTTATSSSTTTTVPPTTTTTTTTRAPRTTATTRAPISDEDDQGRFTGIIASNGGAVWTITGWDGVPNPVRVTADTVLTPRARPFPVSQPTRFNTGQTVSVFWHMSRGVKIADRIYGLS